MLSHLLAAAGAFRQQLLYQGGCLATERLHLLHGNSSVTDTYEVIEVRLFRCTIYAAVTELCLLLGSVPDKWGRYSAVSGSFTLRNVRTDRVVAAAGDLHRRAGACERAGADRAGSCEGLPAAGRVHALARGRAPR